MRSPIRVQDLVKGEAPYDQSYEPAVEMMRAFGQDRVIFVCSDHLDDYLVDCGLPHHWNVLIHVNGYNEGNFWKSLVMAQLAEIYLEYLSLASLLLHQMGRELGVPLWTLTDSDLVSQAQLGWQGREPLIYVRGSLYITQEFWQKIVKGWGPPPAASGPPGLVYCAGSTRMTETGGAEFLHATLDMMHFVSATTGLKPKLHIQGPASQCIQLRAIVRKYCDENNFEDLSELITSMPFFRNKQAMLRWLWEHPELLSIAGCPINPHTGCLDAAITCHGTLNLTPENSEWHANVAKHISSVMGLGDVLNTTTREQYTKTGAMILSGKISHRAMTEHNHGEMMGERGLYCPHQLGEKLMSTIPHLLRHARSAAPGTRMPDIDTAELCTSAPSHPFALVLQINHVDDSEAMKMQAIMQRFVGLGCFNHDSMHAAETALGVALRYMSLDPSTVRRGGARVTVQGIVKYPGDQGKASAMGWRRDWMATVKFDYDKIGLPKCTSATMHNSESVRESQSLILIERSLQRAGRMKHMVRKLIPVLEGGRAAVGFIKTGHKDKSRSDGMLIFMFCETIPDGCDLHGSKIVQDVRDAWRERGEIVENARALARGILHAGAWMSNEHGWVQLDGSWGNLYTVPWSLSSPGLNDPAVAGRMPEPAGIGFCDLGGSMYIGTRSERKDKQARPATNTTAAPLFRAITQTEPALGAKKPRIAVTGNVGILTNAKLLELAEHRKHAAVGNGRPTGGTPLCTCRKMKKEFDAAGADEVMAADKAILWQSATAGVIILSLFCPPSKNQSSDEYIRERELAAQSQADMRSFMARYVREDVEIKQQKTADLFANLIWNLIKENQEKRITDDRALTHPALSHIIFTQEVLDAVQGDGYLIPGRNGPAGSVFEHLTSKAWLLKPDGPGGSWGTGAFAAEDIKDGELACLYAALAHGMSSLNALHEYPPCHANVTIFDGTDPEMTAIGELPLEVLHDLGAPGVFLNAKPTGHGANLRLARKERFVTAGGIIMIPYYATEDIPKGNGGYWQYEEGKGVGGADSYSFDDSSFEIEDNSSDLSRVAQADGGAGGM